MVLEREEPSELRINPLELVGPPSYEEAVQMPRLVHSMDALNEISVENDTLRAVNSVDNLRVKKRRSRKRTPRKRTQSEDDLLRREERRQLRIRRERTNSSGNICETDQSRVTNPSKNSRTSLGRRSRRQSAVVDEIIVESSSGKDRPRPQTPSTKRRKRRQMSSRDVEHVTDDEDSEVQTSIVIRELKREPRSGYRDSSADHD